MKKTFRILSVAALLSLSSTAFALSHNKLCEAINGFYSGTYNDPSGLFPSGNFPMNVYLKYHHGMIYGYTLSAQDASGPAYGQDPYAVIWGSCKKNTISNLYIIKNTASPCGDPAAGPMALTKKGPLNLQLNYENAMTSAPLKASLTTNNSEFPSKAAIKQAVDKNLLQTAVAFSKKGIQTCH